MNGKQQANLHSLALGAPRTTRTQEGIAVLSELVTNSMDITRLRRVALRVIAVQNALDGADFIEVFKFFLESGWLNPPQYMPVWAGDLRRIAALMAYSAFVSKIHLENVYLNRAIELEEEFKT